MFLLLKHDSNFSNTQSIDVSRDQFAWLTPLKGGVSELCLTASNKYVDDFLSFISEEIDINDLSSIPAALSMYDSNGKLPIEGFLSDTMDLPLDICQGDEICIYTLPDRLRFVVMKIPVGFSDNPGNLAECLDVSDFESAYCPVKISGPPGLVLGGNPIGRKRGIAGSYEGLKTIGDHLNLYSNLINLFKAENRDNDIEIFDVNSVKAYLSEIDLFNITTTLSQEQVLLTMMSMYAIIASPGIGMCIPKACSVEDFNKNFDYLTANSSAPVNITINLNINGSTINNTVNFDLLPLSIHTSVCYSNENIHGTPEELPGVYVFFYVLFSAIAACTILGTLVEIAYTFLLKKSTPEDLSIQLLLCFSLYKNGRRLLSTESVGKDHLDCMNGMRFLSMTWVVLGHALFLPFQSKTRNIKDAIDLYGNGDSFAFEAVMNALPSVDSFFLMSGALTTYIFMKELDRAGRDTKKHMVTFVMYYVHRYLRLTIPYFLIMGVLISVAPYISYGPDWEGIIRESDSCRKNWWKHFLYIQTLLEDNQNSCMAVTWYLVDDMMYHIFSPLIIYPIYFLYKKTGKHVWSIAFWAFALFWFTFGNFYISYTTEQPPSPMIPIPGLDTHYTYHVDFYSAPWTRYQAYLIGILLGYILHHMRGKPVKLRKDLNIFGWEASFLAAFAVVYGLYNARKTHEMTLFWSTMYNTFHRIAWNGALAWVIFSCSKGYGGLINEFLSWSVFAPLSRLTFCTYLIHINIIGVFGASVLSSFPNDVEMFTSVWYYLAIQFISCAVAFVFALLFEIPATRAEKLVVQAVLGSFLRIDNGNTMKKIEIGNEITTKENGKTNKAHENDSTRDKIVEANITPKIPDEQSTNSSESIASEHNSISSKSGQSAPPSSSR